MFDFLRRHRHERTDDETTRDRASDRASDTARDTGPQFREPSGSESWRASAHRDRAQRQDEPGYGGAGYFGSSASGGQSFNGAQRLYPGDPGYRAHPTQPVTSARIGTGRHTGPKDYQRADDLIRDDICERLTLHDDVEVSDVTVDVQAGVVTLSGTVGDRFEKRMIEDIADAVFGVQDVENHIRVRRRDERLPSERTLNLS